jgi:hypothetical protein
MRVGPVGEGSKGLGALHEFIIGSWMKSRTLTPSARRVTIDAMGSNSTSEAISVEAEEGVSRQLCFSREREQSTVDRVKGVGE